MDWWHCFYGALSAAECDALTGYALRITPQTGSVGHGGRSAVNEKMRRSTIRWVPRDDPRLSWLYLRIARLALEANAGFFGLDLTGTADGFRELQFTEYHGSADAAGHYDWHEDNSWRGAGIFDRKLSMVIQLSRPGDYTGGRLELDRDPLPPDAFINRGDVIFFPSFNRHRVTPVTAGTRYSLVTWFLGPRPR